MCCRADGIEVSAKSDVIVLGLGAMGSATCHQLAARGLVRDRDRPAPTAPSARVDSRRDPDDPPGDRRGPGVRAARPPLTRVVARDRAAGRGRAAHPARRADHGRAGVSSCARPARRRTCSGSPTRSSLAPKLARPLPDVRRRAARRRATSSPRPDTSGPRPPSRAQLELARRARRRVASRRARRRAGRTAGTASPSRPLQDATRPGSSSCAPAHGSPSYFRKGARSSRSTARIRSGSRSASASRSSARCRCSFGTSAAPADSSPISSGSTAFRRSMGRPAA